MVTKRLETTHKAVKPEDFSDFSAALHFYHQAKPFDLAALHKALIKMTISIFQFTEKCKKFDSFLSSQLLNSYLHLYVKLILCLQI